MSIAAAWVPRRFRGQFNFGWIALAVWTAVTPEAARAQEPIIAEGWLAAHDSSGEPTVWFPSRGC